MEDLASALKIHENRSHCFALCGHLMEDKNISGGMLLVVERDVFYSFKSQDIVELEERFGKTTRVWICKSAEIWESRRMHGGQLFQRSIFVIEELQAAPAPRITANDPSAGAPADQNRLSAGATIEGSAKLFALACAGGDQYPNNCAHFLSNAFIRAGYDELRQANDCINARCETTAKRPIRARDMRCWFESKATQTGGAVSRNTGFWAVFQLDESQYWGGHVAIIDSNAWKYYGTGWYGDWNQESYKW